MNDFTVLTLPDSVIDQIPAPGSGRDPDRFQIMIRFAPGLVESADASIDGFGGRYEKTVTPPGLLNGAASDGVIKVFSFPTSAPKDVLLDALSNRPGVEAVEIDHVVSSDLASSDLLYQVGITWGLYGPSGDGIGSYSNYFGSAADVAWANAQASADGHIGSMKTVIGVIDTGIDPTHPDLYLNIWVNQNEIPTGLASDQDGDGIITFRDLNVKSGGSYVNAVSDINSNGYIDADDILSDSAWADGIDDDSNGYTDDLFGWDFYNNDNRPFESFEDNPNKIIDREPSDSYHGTHVAGT
ncbi:MAG: S8 family serine peptidase, partial [Novosphingobium sp.]|nr:S8 family serine peptidase [Novosphingobium sp.]